LYLLEFFFQLGSLLVSFLLFLFFFYPLQANLYINSFKRIILFQIKLPPIFWVCCLERFLIKYSVLFSLNFKFHILLGKREESAFERLILMSFVLVFLKAAVFLIKIFYLCVLDICFDKITFFFALLTMSTFTWICYASTLF